MDPKRPEQVFVFERAVEKEEEADGMVLMATMASMAGMTMKVGLMKCRKGI